MNNLFAIRAYLGYWLNCIDDHSLHSPFLFDYYISVIRKDDRGHEAIEALRKKLLSDRREMFLTGSGTRPGGGKRLISDIAKTSLSPMKYGALYERTAAFFNCRTIVELGTSLGITTLYFARPPQAMVHTFEAEPALCDIAEITFSFGQAKNITLHRGAIDQTLTHFVLGSRRIDLVFMDANHQYEPTIRYFNTLLPRLHDRSVLIVDDIHRSPDMERAWHEISNHQLVYVTADLYRCGIAWFDPSISRQHVVLDF